MFHAILAAAAIACALCAVRTQRLLLAALWLAGTSALTSILMYSAGAHEAAVIELSVGAGLVFILFVFAINLASRAGAPEAALVPRPLALTLLALVAVLLGALAWPRTAGLATVPAAPLNTSLWSERQVDLLLQIVLLFTGAVTVAGLLAGQAVAASVSETEAALQMSAAAPTPLLSAEPPIPAPDQARSEALHVPVEAER